MECSDDDVAACVWCGVGLDEEGFAVAPHADACSHVTEVYPVEGPYAWSCSQCYCLLEDGDSYVLWGVADEDGEYLYSAVCCLGCAAAFACCGEVPMWDGGDGVGQYLAFVAEADGAIAERAADVWGRSFRRRWWRLLRRMGVR